MSDSILTSTKKVLGLEESYTAFDLDVMTHINSSFSTLAQLGVGPPGGFMIEDATAEWATFLGSDKLLNMVRTYVFLKVRLLFDPPSNAYVMDAFKEQIKELEWRLNVHMEDTIWTDPDPDDDLDPPDDQILDGGSP